MTVVIDASVALCWLFADEQSDAADAIFRHVHLAGAHAPSLLPIEIGNALNVGLRCKRISEAELYRAAVIIEDLPIVLDDADGHRILHETALLARRYELSLYDAMYLELSMRTSLPLATVDKRLAIAAGRAGISLWDQAKRA